MRLLEWVGALAIVLALSAFPLYLILAAPCHGC